jgi:hypothetical protein
MRSWIVFGGSVAALVGSLGAAGSHAKGKAKVVYFLSTDCPVAMQYTPRINRIAQEFSDVDYQAYFPNDLETRAGISKYKAERGYAFPADLDLGAREARRLGVKTVPSVVVLDSDGKVLYRGGIDDNQDVNFVKKHYLEDALSAVEKGKAPALKEAPTFGCIIMPSDEPPALSKVNYAEHVAPILEAHCVNCHRPGEVAPFSLQGYDQAKKWAPMIDSVAHKGQMPPWKAVAGFGEFMDENRLTETQLETLKVWREAGAPKGDLAKSPKPKVFTSDWALGKPDMVLSPDRDFALGAEGSDEYRNFVVHKNTSSEPEWVTGMDVRPGNRLIVHHIIAFIDTGTQAEKREQNNKDGRPGYATFGGPGFIPAGSLGGWAPGLQPRHTMEGTAFKVPPGASVVMQVHYHRDGKPETDRTKLGIYLAKQKPTKELRLQWLANPMFKLKAGDKESKVNLHYKTPVDVTIYGAMPHMHLLGRSMKASVTFPDGTVKPLVYINDWDFNWQMMYILRQPMKLPAGSSLNVEGIYDNSAENPRQPTSTPRDVTWGEQTTDEMFLLVVPYTIDAENLN